MNRRMLTIISVVVLCAVALCMSLTGRKVSAQSAPALSDPVYNPYPPGILPANLSSEIARVLAELDFVESRAITRWHNLTPPTLTGQPPILKNTRTEPVETPSELMNYDRRITPNRNQASSSCHMPCAARSSADPGTDL